MMLIQIALACLLAAAPPQGRSMHDATPGTIHFVDGSTLRFEDLIKFRFGTEPGQILLEPRGMYVEHLNTSLHLPARELREILVAAHRPAHRTDCKRPCGIAAARFTVTTVGGITAVARAGFADNFIVLARGDRYSDGSVRVIPWAKLNKDGSVALHVRRITFDAR